MYCPSCSTKSIEGAKFCKACGMNLNVVTQALNGGVVISDPVRDREYKRARKQISDGIQGSAIGTALLIAAVLSYALIPKNSYVYALSLSLALAGIIKLFRSVGSIIDAKVGPKLLDPALQPRGTGGLNSSQLNSPVNVRPSQRLVPDQGRGGGPPVNPTRPVSAEGNQNLPPTPPAQNVPHAGTGRVNREYSTPLRNFDKEDDLISKLRN